MQKDSQKETSGEHDRFGLVKSDVIQDPNLSITAKTVYALLSTFANRERICYPSINHLAELLNVGRRTVERAIKELKEKDYVRKEGKTFWLR